MNYVFLGTPRFAEIVLERLLEGGFLPSMVVCNPDKPVGRKKIIIPPPVKNLAAHYGIKVYQPSRLKLDEWKKEVGSIDFAVVAAYSKIIPEDIIATAKKGFIGVHPSLLPELRGPSPIRSAILEGKKETGITLFLIDREVDHGPILAKLTIPILEKDTYETLLEKLGTLGGDLLIEILPKYLKGDIEPKEQDHTKATFTKKFSVEDAKINYIDLLEAVGGSNKEKAIYINRVIRALNPEPGAWVIVEEPPVSGFPKAGKRVKLLKSEINDGKLVLKKIQIEGKTPKYL